MMNKTYNPCDDCRYSYSRNSQESEMCEICEFTYFKELVPEAGHWVAKPELIRSLFARNHYCSVCKYEPTEVSKFCPSCGARMRGNT